MPSHTEDNAKHHDDDGAKDEGDNDRTDPRHGVVAPDKGVLDGIFDASDRIEGGGVVIWWNNIEKDSR